MRTKLRDIKVGDRVVYQQYGEAEEVANNSFGLRARIRTDDGEEFWVDANRL